MKLRVHPWGRDESYGPQRVDIHVDPKRIAALVPSGTGTSFWCDGNLVWWCEENIDSLRARIVYAGGYQFTDPGETALEAELRIGGNRT